MHSKETSSPSFFIVGAPKAGTTALDNYLSQHPELFLGKKETHHFATDCITPKHNYYEKRNYLNLFKAAQSHQVCGESSVFYLSSTVAAENLHAFQPNARIIIMLRNPVTQIPAMHSQCVFGGHETEINLANALELEPQRALQLKSERSTLQIPQKLLYTHTADYAPQIQRYYDCFPRNQIKVILFENFIEDPQLIFDQTLEFLEVSPYSLNAFEKINSNKAPRSRLLAKLLSRPPNTLKAIMPLALREAIHARLTKVNRKQTTRASLPAAIATQLERQFEAKISPLELLTDLDLTSWKMNHTTDS